VSPANSEDAPNHGTLYVIATPIGNLEDITYRAVRILGEVDLVIAEDTRRSRKLLDHYSIDATFGPSLYEGVDERSYDRVLNELFMGKDIALISDAGTPLIQDPGYPLVRDAVAEGIRALVASGLPTDHFIFDGVPSKKSGRRTAYFQSLTEESRTVVLYESPHRILKTLRTISETLPNRDVVLCRELTKAHEEVMHGTPDQLLENLEGRASIKGEFVLILAGKPRRTP